MKVLIADDEPIVRDGLKSIIDWEKLGFVLCGEAGEGAECLQKMLSLSPDLVLLDIKMPKMHGLEVLEKAKEQGFRGRIIIISGYSDFKHAQTAIRFGVNNYLLKPIDENELEDAVKSIKASIEMEQQKSVNADQVIEKAKESIINDIIKGKASIARGVSTDGNGDVYGIKLFADSYRVVVFDRLDYAEVNPVSFFSKLFSLSRLDMNAIEAVRISDRYVYLLKGSTIIDRIEKLSRDSNRNAKELLGRGIFAAQGRTVYLQQEIVNSYKDAAHYIHRKFFYPRELCFVDGPDPNAGALDRMISDADTRSFIQRVVSLVEACNNDKACEALQALYQTLSSSTLPPEEIKGYLTSLMIQIKRAILDNHKQLDASFESDAEIIAFIGSKERLYEITDYLVSRIQGLIVVIGNYSRDHTINKVLHYIDKNYDKNLKLESLAELFGYNSAYLGKVFKSRADENFNTYLDRVRIANAKEMLKQHDIKAYEISEKVGYHNFDYFCKKFKKHTGESPSEYRKRLGITADTENDSSIRDS